MIRFWLFIIRLLKPLWKRLGVNYDQLKALMEARLLMETRRRKTWQQNKSSNSGGSSWLIYLSFFFIGGGALAAIIQFDHVGSGLTLYFLIWMVFFSVTLISDFTEVLIDVRDNYIVLPRPVNDRTISASRLMHIVIYLAGLTVPFMLPALIYMAVMFGITGVLIFIFLQLLSELMVVFGINLIYLGILRFASPARFRDMIGYFQIALTVLIFAGYYLTPRLLDWDRVTAVNFLEKPLSTILPPAWLGSIWEVLHEGAADTVSLFRAGLGILVPLLGIWLVVRFLAGGFNRKLMAISMGVKSDAGPVIRKRKQPGSGYMDRLSRWVCRSQAEKAAFDLTWLMTARSRDFKVKVYPSFGFIPVFFLYMAIQGKGTLAERFMEIRSGNYFLLLLYMLLLAVSTPLVSIRFSDKYKASWLFITSPVARKGELIAGAFKAVMGRFFVPFFLVFAVITLSFWGVKTAPHILLAFVNLSIISVIITYLTPDLPLAAPWEEAKKGGQVATNILTTVAVGVIGGFHYLLVLFTPGWVSFVAAVVLILPLYFLLKRLSGLKWT